MHVLRNRVSPKNIQLQMFREKVAQGLVHDTEKEITEWPRATCAGRQASKNCYAYKVPAIHTKVKGQ
jgi:hypothetical protein